MSFSGAMLEMYLREHIPLKQGLRRRIFLSSAVEHRPQRAYSTKTRIKTMFQILILVGDFLREHIPLKQGLRQSS